MAGLRRWRASRSAWWLASLALVVSIAAGGASVATATPASAASTPACTFNGADFPIVGGLTPGATVQVDCTGLPALHPYLLFETSLLIAVDPATASLLSGSLSPTTFLGALSAVPLINVAAFSFPYSDASGNLDYAYKTPTTQAPDPNASCPPSTEEFDSGLIGCALALVDLTTASAVSAGSAVLQYQGEQLLPPGPTLAVKPKSVSPGQTARAKDAKGATTYWWLATLAELEGLLGASGPPPTASAHFAKSVADSSLSVTAATYNGSTFTPPKLSGTLVVPSTLAPGEQKVKVELQADLSGLAITISATEAITVE
jgi:hypothetical protein